MDIQVFIEFEKEVGGKELKACVTLGDLYDLAVK